ncbi:hypothetical protein O181_051642 [Austropuccinia psidii MF-1]|uniref:Uncharacterized protein n=1 Tax=Austropuccinia psidii MF-1 TaxID=1389203 RepID=A0A9Q3E1C2_9BASI|nr:hypothetical protein [Austropuccinia psidii MF-1]
MTYSLKILGLASISQASIHAETGSLLPNSQSRLSSLNHNKVCQNSGTQRYQVASPSFLKAQNMLPSMVTLFPKLTHPAAELLPEGGIEPISNLMKVESNPESLTTTPPANI